MSLLLLRKQTRSVQFYFTALKIHKYSKFIQLVPAHFKPAFDSSTLTRTAAALTRQKKKNSFAGKIKHLTNQNVRHTYWRPAYKNTVSISISESFQFQKGCKESPWQMSEMRLPEAQEGGESIICLAGLVQDVGMCTARCGSLIKLHTELVPNSGEVFWSTSIFLII